MQGRLDEHFVMVLGDSVLWGQGLRQQDKFHSRVVSWLQLAVQRQIGAHLSRAGTCFVRSAGQCNAA